MSEEAEPQAWNVGQDDPEDRYPWRWTPYAEQPVDGVTLGWISTPNGRRPNGEMHTANTIASNIWEPDGHLICAVVNEWAHQQFGTPAPGDPMIPKVDRPLRVEVYETTDLFAEPPAPDHRFRVVHNSNGEIMAHGEGYADKRDRDHAVALLHPDLDVVEVEG